MKYRIIRVSAEDYEKMRNQCKDLFLMSHPEMKGMFMSNKFLFCKIVEFYLKGTFFE